MYSLVAHRCFRAARRCKLGVTCSVIVLSCLSAASTSADGALLKPKDQRALLTVSISVEGGVEKPGEYRDEVVKWTTKREFNATVEMVADKPDTVSITTNTMPSDDQMAAMNDMQKQLEACGNDQACMMELAMKSMNSPLMQPPQQSAPRYQLWRAVENEDRLEVSGSYRETLNTVFYTAARETTECTLTLPTVATDPAKLDPKQVNNTGSDNREMQASSARSMVVEIDSVQKTSLLAINSVVSLGTADLKCTQNIGSGPETTQQKDAATLLPRQDIKLPLLFEGKATADSVLASGTASLETQQTINNMGGVGFAMNATAPLKVLVRWQLKAL